MQRNDKAQGQIIQYKMMKLKKIIKKQREKKKPSPPGLT